MMNDELEAPYLPFIIHRSAFIVSKSRGGAARDLVARARTPPLSGAAPSFPQEGPRRVRELFGLSGEHGDAPLVLLLGARVITVTAARRALAVAGRLVR